MTANRQSKSADAVLRDSMAEMPLPEFAEPAFTRPPDLHDARVAIVTTGGLMRPGEDAWTHDDAAFRVFDRHERDLIVGHVSMNFDRSGISADLNVTYPIDRLEEMAADRTIGSVAPHHLSFMGALRGANLLSTLMLDTGPAAAKLLLDDGVDVVVLTPLCPACSRTVLVLGHVLERCGLATITLASNLRLAERAMAPRALYCNFPLGSPLGRPRDPALQRRVLLSAFALLSVRDGPVLDRFPEAVHDEADTPLTCTLPPRFDPALAPEIDEAQGLRAAWERARDINGKTQVGRVLTVDQIGEAIASFIRVRDGEEWKQVFESEDRMLQTAMEIRIYYEEAALGLAEHVPAARAAEAWFYQKTRTGELLRSVAQRLRDSGQEAGLSYMALYYIVPLSQFPGDSANPPWQGRQEGATPPGLPE